MLAVLILKARDAESELMEHLFRIIIHVREHSMTTEESTLVNNLYNRLCKLPPTLYEAIEHCNGKDADTPFTSDPLSSRNSAGPSRLGKQPMKHESFDPLATSSFSTGSGKRDRSEHPSKKPKTAEVHSPDEEFPTHDAGSDTEYVPMDDFDNIAAEEDSCDSVSSSLMDRLVSIKKDTSDLEEKPPKVIEEMPYEFTPGSRYNSNLLYSINEKQLYRRKHRFEKYDRYTCKMHGCQAALNMYGTVLKKTQFFREHNHLDQEETYFKNKFLAKVKDTVQGEVETGIPKLFNELQKNDPVGGANTQLKRIMRNLARIRSQSIKQRSLHPDFVPVKMDKVDKE